MVVSIRDPDSEEHIGKRRTMFTGIVSHIGTLKANKDSLLTFSAPQSFLRKLKKAESVAVNGACLTVIAQPTQQSFSVEIMPETERKTMFGMLRIGDTVNLELPVTAETFISGHIVQGHVDGVGTIERIDEEGKSKILTIRVPRTLSHYIVEKGPVALNGISLTIVEANQDHFTVAVTAFTWRKTMLKRLSIGDSVNIEVDIMAKYIEKIIEEHV